MSSHFGDFIKKRVLASNLFFYIVDMLQFRTLFVASFVAILGDQPESG